MGVPHVVLTDRYAEAVRFAASIHADQTRKGTDIAYLCHPLGVSSLVLEAGGDEDEAMAGLLHDAVEDCGGMVMHARILEMFGQRVAAIVLACSDSTDEAWKASTDYWVRKQRYLDHLASTDDHRAVLVSIADKVHNLRSIVVDLQRHGPSVLGKFNGSPEQILRYYRACLRIAEGKSVPDMLLWPLRSSIEVLASYVEP